MFKLGSTLWDLRGNGKEMPRNALCPTGCELKFVFTSLCQGGGKHSFPGHPLERNAQGTAVIVPALEGSPQTWVGSVFLPRWDLSASMCPASFKQSAKE